MLKLPENFRDMAHASALKTILHQQGVVGMSIAPHIALVDRICDRAEKLEKAGLLVGDSPAAVANVIYGGWWLWMFVWTNRALLWQIINLIAQMVFVVASDGIVRHTARA